MFASPLPEWMNAGMPQNVDPSMMQTGTVTPNKGGMFGGGKFGVKEALAFGLAGLVSRRNPALLQGLMGMVMQRQRDAQEAAQYQQHRQDELSDYGEKLKLQSQYKQPEYGEFERALIGKGVQPGTPQWQEAMGTRVNNMLDPMTMTIYGPMPRSALMGAQAPAPKPLTDDDILRMQGGPAATPPATFPRPY